MVATPDILVAEAVVLPSPATARPAATPPSRKVRRLVMMWSPFLLRYSPKKTRGCGAGASHSKNVECRGARVMLTVRVDAARLARSRFALSRLAELSCALEVLTHPGGGPLARRWVAATHLDVDAVALVHALVEHEHPYVPDFLVPLPDSYEPSLDEELALVAATPPAVVREQLSRAFPGGLPPA